MFEYTKSAYKYVSRKIKIYLRLIRILLAIVTIAYFTYALITKIGNFYANIVLASIYLIYLLFQIITIKKDIKPIKRKVRIIYKIIKLSINAFVLGSNIYSIYVTSHAVKPITIIMSTLMIIFWLIQVMLEIVIDIVLPKKDILIAGFYKDIYPYVQKINAYNAKLNNDEIIIPLDEYEKEVDLISSDAEQMIIEKNERKEQRKFDKKEARKQRFKDAITFKRAREKHQTKKLKKKALKEENSKDIENNDEK